MQFDPDNIVIKLCTRGMELEASEKPGEAKELFMQAWNESITDFEKFTSAHYVARHQPSVEGKLEWDLKALGFALKIKDEPMKANYPSLYLNIGKCYEDLKEYNNAFENYKAAYTYIHWLPADGYGKMIRSGIEKAMERVSGSRPE
jgi:tetratricopeptide (TPR) repeat protein